MDNSRVSFFWLTWYIRVPSGSESRLVRVPVNTAVVQSSAVTLECSSDDSRAYIYWFNRLCVQNNKSGDCQQHDYIYNGFPNKLGISVDSTRFSVRSANTTTHVTRDVIINPVQPSDAGIYLCVEYVGADAMDTSSAQLIVIGMKTTYDHLKDNTHNWRQK